MGLESTLIFLPVAVAATAVTDAVSETCIVDVRKAITKCRPVCGYGSFSLYGMVLCQPWLSCDEIDRDVHLLDSILGYGAVKMVKLGKWQTQNVAISYLTNSAFREDFDSNLKRLVAFNSDHDLSQDVIQLIGFCNQGEHIMQITEYHPLSSADKLDDILSSQLPNMDNLETRFKLCVNYVSILHKLHSHKKGAHVLCDSNNPKKALSQFLLSDDLRLLLNDMDALPVLNQNNKFSIKCGHRELSGDFVAPEQLWPHSPSPFNDDMMPGYDEKTDIWKVPDISLYLISKVANANKLILHLFNIHAKCKLDTPQSRPTAREILKVYQSVGIRLGFISKKEEKSYREREEL